MRSGLTRPATGGRGGERGGAGIGPIRRPPDIADLFRGFAVAGGWTTEPYAPNDIAAANDRPQPGLGAGRSAQEYASHRAILEVADELARLVGNAGDMETKVWINTVLVTARGLHSNFYENELPEDMVRDGIVSCVGLSRRLYELFWPEGAAFDGNI